MLSSDGFWCSMEGVAEENRPKNAFITGIHEIITLRMILGALYCAWYRFLENLVVRIHRSILTYTVLDLGAYFREVTPALCLSLLIARWTLVFCLYIN